MKELKASLEEAEQLKDQSVSTMMKERVKLMEAQKEAETFKNEAEMFKNEAEMFKNSTVKLARQKDVLEVCAKYVCVLVTHTCTHARTHTHTACECNV